MNRFRQIGAGLWLLSLTLMTTELVLTRIFSVVIWYHFAFVAISVALFGLGAAAIVVHRLQDRLAPEATPALLARASSWLAWLLIAVNLLLLRLAPDWFAVGPTATPFTQLTLKLGLLFLATAAPFFVGGLAVSLVMTRHGARVHELYFLDLLGAACGCLGVIPLLSVFGGPHALLCAALFAALAAVVFAWGERRALRRASFSMLAVLLCCAAAIDGGWLRVRMAKGFDLALAPVEYERWNSFSMIGVFAQQPLRGWGLSPHYRGPLPQQRQLLIDMSALTPITAFDGDLTKVGYVRYDLSALTFRARPSPARVAVIGAGGGKDVLAALSFGARKVDAVEINPLIVEDVMRRRYRDFSGGLYARSDVRVHIDDGRSFLRRSREQYDVILLSMVDTSAATAAGAYALTENGLYTVEAFGDYLARLAPGGVLGVSTVSMPGLAVGARLATLARAALIAKGDAPARAVMVAQTPWLGLPGAVLHAFMIKPDGFAQEEVGRLRQVVEGIGFSVGYAAGTPHQPASEEQGWIAHVLRATDERALARDIEGWPLDVSVVTDDRPYFFYQDRLRNFGSALFSVSTENLFGNGLHLLAKLLLISLLFAGALVLPPLLGARGDGADRASGARDKSALPACTYVALLGLGFMFVEVSLIQQLSLQLGKPTLTLSAVLFTLLCAGALGSRVIGPRVRSAAGLGRVLAVTLAYGFALMFALAPLFTMLAGESSGLRASIGALLIAPLGVMLGVPYPTGLACVARNAPDRVPWMWGINSASSVLGSVLATLTCIHFGGATALGTGLALYGVAALVQPSLWSGDAPGR